MSASASVAPTPPGQTRSYPVAARALLRPTLLDAVRDQLRTRAWTEVTMADVARAAGVSRQTVYNEFGSRPALAQAYVLCEADRFLATIEEAISEHLDDPIAAMTAAFEVFLAAADGDPLVRALISSEGGDELLALVTTHGHQVHDRATAHLASFLAEGWPTLTPPKARLLADAVVRLAISHATLPSGSSHETARSIGELLGPFVERALAAK